MISNDLSLQGTQVIHGVIHRVVYPFLPLVVSTLDLLFQDRGARSLAPIVSL